MNTLIKLKNVKLFMSLETASTLKEAAANSGLTVQHSLRLIRVWLSVGYYSKNGNSYVLTSTGQEIKRKLSIVQ